ncbi:hypothetical protein FS749_010587 [Ceratobasidium sp. UAMH 11750]|nr:hypothetical protein FS749_010587 [Ceratobasidium sp. UAMH 11750]
MFHRYLLVPSLRPYVMQEAQKDGIFAGVTAGLLGALLGSRGLGFNRNKSLFTGLGKRVRATRFVFSMDRFVKRQELSRVIFSLARSCPRGSPTWNGNGSLRIRECRGTESETVLYPQEIIFPNVVWKFPGWTI